MSTRGKERTIGQGRPGHEDERIVLAHGGGGELMHQLIREHLLKPLGNPLLAPLDDGAILPAAEADGPLVFTSDSFVVQPLEFPGGDIGRLAVCGTVNDLAAMGARPVALSLALVLEEGLPIATLDRIVASVAAAAEEACVPIAAGDLKVIERHRGDEMIITTAGVGRRRREPRLGIGRIEPGDRVILTGRIAEHGLAVMSAREGLAFQSELRSDVAPLAGLVDAMLATGADVKFMRDPTRGGLASVLADIVEGAKCSVEIDEAAIPISGTARHAAEMLGLDPLTVANEGKIIVVLGEADVARVLAACHRHLLAREAAEIGRVTDVQPPMAELITDIGGRRVVQRPYGEELPRIC